MVPTPMVYTRIPKVLASSAAVAGAISPRLFSPSVSRMTTLLIAVLSLSRETAVANPLPMAVPSSIIPLSIFLNRLITVAWSVVSGHWVKLSPEKTTRPILSFGRPNDKIGLVVFSGESFTQCPLTTDHATVINLFRNIESGMIEDGTAIGNGLATAVSRLKESTAISKVVILLTDGENNRGEIAPVTAAELAKTFGIRVYTIGVGTIGTAPYPMQTPFGVQVRDVEVKIDEVTLQKIASITDGAYFRATNNNKLAEIYKEIDLSLI